MDAQIEANPRHLSLSAAIRTKPYADVFVPASPGTSLTMTSQSSTIASHENFERLVTWSYNLIFISLVVFSRHCGLPSFDSTFYITDTFVLPHVYFISQQFSVPLHLYCFHLLLYRINSKLNVHNYVASLFF